MSLSMVHCLGQEPEAIEAGGVLDGDNMLPGSTLDVSSIFGD